jgi:hypothetical protein
LAHRWKYGMCTHLLYVNNLLGIFDLKHQLANPFPPNKRRGKKGGCRVPQVNKDEDAPAV